MAFFSDRPTDHAFARQSRRRYVLRREGRDVAIGDSPITVGRSSTCDLVLDDPRVSATHARLLAGPEGVTITDLGSRNGVFVNGVKVEREAFVAAGDLLTFGDVVFEVVAHDVLDHDFCDSDRPTLNDVVSLVARESVEHPQDTDRLMVLVAVIEKAIALEHVGTVEPVAADCLARIARDLEDGKPIGREIVGLAASSAMKLASLTGTGIWVNLLFRIYHARAEIMPTEHIDALYDILRRTRGVDWELLSDYVLFLRTLTSRMTPAQRFASKRIEGLLRFGPG